MSPRFYSWLAGLRASMRFSLRTLLAATLIAAVLFAWFGWRLRKSQRQARAVAVLQEFGALYAYDFQGPFVRSTTRPYGKLLVAPGQSAYPRRLRKLLGVDFLHNITRVHLETSYRLPDEDIERLWTALGDLPDLVYLEVSGPVTKPGVIQRLQRSARVQRLAIRWGHIADDDLAILSRMPRLQELNLNETPVRDAALVQVGRVASLRSLELHHTQVSDAGLAGLVQLRQLRHLRLSATAVGNAGIRHLRGLASLHELDLTHTKISDAALEDVASFANLDQLDLSMTAVTEAGLARLARLARLRSLKLEAMPALRDVLAVIPKLPALEELHGPALVGDLSRIAACPKLRVLRSSFFPSPDAGWEQLRLPATLQDISGLPLTDETIDALAALQNLRIVHAMNASYLQDPERFAEEQRLRARVRAALPAVTLIER